MTKHEESMWHDGKPTTAREYCKTLEGDDRRYAFQYLLHLTSPETVPYRPGHRGYIGVSAARARTIRKRIDAFLAKTDPAATTVPAKLEDMLREIIEA